MSYWYECQFSEICEQWQIQNICRKSNVFSKLPMVSQVEKALNSGLLSHAQFPSPLFFHYGPKAW